MTNLIATVIVTIVTNQTDVFDQPSPYGCLVYGCKVDHYQEAVDAAKAKKTVITTCKEITTLKFDWNGPREVVSERILWSTNHVMKLEWSTKP